MNKLLGCGVGEGDGEQHTLLHAGSGALGGNEGGGCGGDEEEDKEETERWCRWLAELDMRKWEGSQCWAERFAWVQL